MKAAPYLGQRAAMIGQTVSHYRITEKLGAGGMGEVYLAEDISLERNVALKFPPKVLQQDSIVPQRLLSRAKPAVALDRPFIRHIHEIAEDQGHAFIAMECLECEKQVQRVISKEISSQLEPYGEDFS